MYASSVSSTTRLVLPITRHEPPPTNLGSPPVRLGIRRPSLERPAFAILQSQDIMLMFTNVNGKYVFTSLKKRLIDAIWILSHSRKYCSNAKRFVREYWVVYVETETEQKRYSIVSEEEIGAPSAVEVSRSLTNGSYG